MDGAIVEFERYFVERQRSAGRDPVPLIGAESSIIKSFMYYLATKEEDVDYSID